MTVPLRVRWGDAQRPHFLLTDAKSVRVNVYRDVPAGPDWWDKGQGTRITPSSSAPTQAVFDVPPNALLRLQFSLSPSADGTDMPSGLDVVQLLQVNDKGTVNYVQYAIFRREVVVTQNTLDALPGRKPEVRTPDTMEVHATRHPVLDPRLSATGPVIRADFIDITSLWWDTHYGDTPLSLAKDITDPATGKNYPDARHRFPFNPWYLDPRCHGDPVGLRVLASTWGVPLIWFAVIPPTARAALKARTTIGGTVFFRPVSSGYPYSSTDVSGLRNKQHATTGMANLARYLLTGRNRVQAQTLDVYALEDKALLLDHLLAVKEPRGPARELVPVRASSRVRSLPVGLESRLARAAALAKDAQQPEQRVLLLPVPAADGIEGGYGAAMRAELTGHVSQALALLWSYGAVGGPDQPLTADGIAPTGFGPAPAPLQLDKLVWIAGYSRGGEAASQALVNNAKDVSRFISIDDRTADRYQERLADAARIIAKANRRLRVFMVRSPGEGGRPAALIKALEGAKAEVNFLPKGDFATFWAKPPFTDRTTWQHYMLAEWDNRSGDVAADVKAEAEHARKERDYSSRYDDFQHVAAVVAGEIFDQEPQNAGSHGFVEQCFGP